MPHPIKMNTTEKLVRDFYATFTKEELLNEIFKDEASLRSFFPRIKDRRFQDDIESRIAILKDMASKL